MAYVEKTLQEWITENPNYREFSGTTAGVPLAFQSAAGAPDLEASKWKVWDWVSELPDTNQAPAEADISTTGKTSRSLLPIVPDAPAASELEIKLGADTDAAIDALEALVSEYQDALKASETFYLAHFLGEGKKSQIYAAAVSWGGGINGTFPDPLTTTIAITPDLGKYNKHQEITVVGG